MAKDFAAGWFGGCAGIIVGHPFDTVKVRLQTQTESHYRSMVDCFLKTARTEGFRGLYKGMLSPLVSSAAVNAITFGIHHNIMRILAAYSDQSKRLPLWCYFVSGASAGAVQTAVSGPAELIKTRLQLDSQGKRGKQRYSSPWNCGYMIAREEGARGLLRGCVPTLLRDSPGFGFYFFTYEGCTRLLPGLLGGNTDSNSTFVMLIAGGLGGMAAWFFSYPFDVVKSRLQNDGANGITKYKNMRDCFRKSYKEGGVELFTRGLGTTLVRAFPVNAVTFYAVFFFLNFPTNIERKPHLTLPEKHSSTTTPEQRNLQKDSIEVC